MGPESPINFEVRRTMNFQQLRIIRETVRQNFNLTEASAALYTSQSGVSKHIKDLEDELGVQLFIRKGKRLLGLTEPGQALLGIVERMLVDADNIKRLADDFNKVDEGTLTIATTHTQARYVLPPIVNQFKKDFPKVHLILQQASPVEITEMLLDDVGLHVVPAADGAEALAQAARQSTGMMDGTFTIPPFPVPAAPRP